MKCKICGCSDEKACEGGCVWVDENLCSKCEDIYNYIQEVVADFRKTKLYTKEFLNDLEDGLIKSSYYKTFRKILEEEKGRIKK